ncbi:MAG TPA: DUF92 domain-containing protein [Chitinophagaceae bacterium]
MIELILVCLIIISSVYFSIYLKKLTIPAAITGGILAAIIYYGVGTIGIALLGTFFILGTSATVWHFNKKKPITKIDKDSGIRNTAQVLANGGVAAVIALLAIIDPDNVIIYKFLLAASLSSATADTLSSELGMVYGKKHYDIISFQPGNKGDDGIISMEGTLIGIIGSCIISLLFVLFEGWNFFILIVVAGTFGNLVDSFIGATLERHNYIKNDMVNFLSNASAAIMGLILSNIS